MDLVARPLLDLVAVDLLEELCLVVVVAAEAPGVDQARALLPVGVLLGGEVAAVVVVGVDLHDFDGFLTRAGHRRPIEMRDFPSNEGTGPLG